MNKIGLNKNEAWLLRVLEETGEVDVNQLLEKFEGQKDWVYQTFQWYLESLRKKGYVQRRKKYGPYRYSLVKEKESIFMDLLSNLSLREWSLPPLKLLQFLVENNKLSAKEEKILRTILEEEPEKKDDD